MAYREGPEHSPLAQVVDRELRVPDGGRLPRLCVFCGSAKRLREERHQLEWRPAGATVLVLFGGIGRALAGGLRRTAQLTFSTCAPCARRTRDASDLTKFLGIGALALALVAATVGLNGHPYAGIAVAVGSALGVALLARRWSVHQIRVVYIHSDGTISLQRVHAAVASAAVENRRDAAGADLERDDDGDDDDDDERPAA